MNLHKNRLKKVAVAVALVIGMASCGSDYTDIEYLQLGNEAIQKGDRNTAIIQYKNAVKDNPKNVEARLALADIYLAMGSGALAEKEIARAAKLSSISEQWQLKRIEAMLLEGKVTEADGLLADKDEGGVLYHEVLALRGDVQLALGNFANARTAYIAANKLDEKNRRALLGLAKSALVENDFKQASNYIETVIAIDPQNWLGWQLKGSILLFQRKFDEATVAIDQAIAKEGTSAGQVRRNNFSLYLDKTKVQIATAEYEKAATTIDSLLKSFDKHPAPHYMKGLLAYQQQDYEAALESFHKVMSISPGYKPALLVMGASQYLLGELEQANHNLTQVVESDPNNSIARKLLGVVRMRLGENDQLMELLLPLADKKSVDGQTLAMIGQAAMLGGQTENGLDFLQRAVQAQPEDNKIRSALIQACMSAGDFDHAIDQLNHIQHISAKAMIIRANIEKGDMAAAEKVAKQLIADEPGNANVYVLLGIVQQAKGQKKLAKVSYLVVIDKDDKNIVARQLLANMAIEAKNEGEATNYYMEIIAINPNDEKALIGLASLSAGGGDDEKALGFLLQSRVGNDKAVRTRIMLANYYFKQKALDEVSELLSELEVVIAGNQELLLLQGRYAEATGEIEQALSIVDKLLGIKPDAAVLHYQKANLLIRIGKKSAAKSVLQKALQLSPDYMPAKLTLAQLELSLGNNRAALNLANEMQQSAKDIAAGYSVAADVYFKQKQYKQAQQAYQKAFARAPVASLAGKLLSSHQKTSNLSVAIKIIRQQLNKVGDSNVRLALAISLHTDQQLELAEKEYLQVLAENKKALVAINNLANLYLETDLAKAKEYAEQAFKLAPSSAAIVDTLGWIYWLQGDVDKAERHMKNALALTSADKMPDIAYHYAVIQAKRGVKEVAINQLTKALASEAHFSERAAATNLLSELR